MEDKETRKLHIKSEVYDRLIKMNQLQQAIKAEQLMIQKLEAELKAISDN